MQTTLEDLPFSARLHSGTSLFDRPQLSMDCYRSPSHHEDITQALSINRHIRVPSLEPRKSPYMVLKLTVVSKAFVDAQTMCRLTLTTSHISYNPEPEPTLFSISACSLGTVVGQANSQAVTTYRLCAMYSALADYHRSVGCKGPIKMRSTLKDSLKISAFSTISASASASVEF